MVTYNDIVNACKRIEKYIYVTPLDFSIKLSDKDTSVYLKLECQQKLKAFKIRGALSKITSLSEAEKSRGIMAVSSGNHGAGVSYASQLLGIDNAKVYVPKTAPKAKVDKIKHYGAKVVQVGENYDEAHREAVRISKEEKLTFIDPCSDVQLIAGQGSIGLEILEQNPEIDVVFVPIGGGGIITGISVAAKHLKPSVKIIGVQTAACPAMVKSLEDNKCYEEFPTEESLCDALVGGVGEIGFQMARQCIDEILLVSEASIRKATVQLLVEEKIVAEPSSAAVVAAFNENRDRFKGKNIALVITGGNLDGDLMRRLLQEV